MAAMKPRTGDGPMEAEREARGLIVLRIPLEGGGRLVISVNDDEVDELKKVLAGIKKRDRLKLKTTWSFRWFFFNLV